NRFRRPESHSQRRNTRPKQPSHLKITDPPQQLTEKQQQRLTKLGVQPDQAPAPAPTASHTAKGPSKAQQAFQRGLTSLAQYVAREGESTVKRTHREKIVINGQEHDLALGIWYSNQKQRRDKLTAEQLDALAELGVSWA
ncbi:helicase associated domain-containing protein, partial [Streptomyces sp. NPDC004330]|uniref:helicase associated domain-containing protein n=1 Tax=Streptomyces sp. NPDC004330 TaxID=3364700 RepID=UPI00368F00AD